MHHLVESTISHMLTSYVSYTAFDTLDVYFDDVAELCLPLRNNFTLHTQSLQRNLDLCTNVQQRHQFRLLDKPEYKLTG